MVIVSESRGWPMWWFCLYLWLVHNANDSERSAFFAVRICGILLKQIPLHTEIAEMLRRVCKLPCVGPRHVFVYLTLLVQDVSYTYDSDWRWTEECFKKIPLMLLLQLKLRHCAALCLQNCGLIWRSINAIWNPLCQNHAMALTIDVILSSA